MTELVAVNYTRDRAIPAEGDVVKIRLMNRLFGPGPTTIYSSYQTYNANTRRTNNYHTAIVRSVRINFHARLSEVEVWPVPAPSGAIGVGYTSSYGWLLTQGDAMIKKHIPMPGPPEATVAPTPERFGLPLYVGGFVDRRSSWVLMEPETVVLGFDRTWKQFLPPVRISMAEYHRLEVYYTYLRTGQPTPLLVPAAPPPQPSTTSGRPSHTYNPDARTAPRRKRNRRKNKQHRETPDAHTPTEGPGPGKDVYTLSAQLVEGLLTPLTPLDHGSSYDVDSVSTYGGGGGGGGDACNNRHLYYYTSTTGDGAEEDDGDGVNPIDFARARAATSPMWKEVVQKWEAEQRRKLEIDIGTWLEGVIEGVEPVVV